MQNTQNPRNVYGEEKVGIGIERSHWQFRKRWFWGFRGGKFWRKFDKNNCLKFVLYVGFYSGGVGSTNWKLSNSICLPFLSNLRTIFFWNFLGGVGKYKNLN